MSESCLKIKRIWSDESMMEFEVFAHTPSISSSINIYLTTELILNLEKAFIEFPKTKDDVFEFTVGSKEGNYAYFLRLKLFLYDHKGHAAIEIEMDNRFKPPYRSSSHFFIATEIGSINEFGKTFKKLLETDFAEIEGIIYSPVPLG